MKIDVTDLIGFRLNLLKVLQFQKFWYNQVSPENNQDGCFTIDSKEDDQNQDDAM